MKTIEHDTQLKLSYGNSRKSMTWMTVEIPWSGLLAKLEEPTRGTETIAQYLSLSKGQQDDLKDIGGFVGGTLNGPRRKANAVIDRCLVTLDFDTIKPFGADAVIDKAASMGFGYCVYSTRKHRPQAPRLRIVYPLSRPVSTDEYDAISRRLAAIIGIEMADPTTFEPSRLMYWPSCCSDSEYLFRYGDMPPVDADFILGTYANWHDWSERPQVPGAPVQYQKLAMKQGDPKTKPGMVGEFCKVYDVPEAMAKFLPGIYEQTDADPNRYTYLGGSTTGGAIIYDNGNFLYSHHSTDPCSGKLVNAFDIVRLHRFGDEDDKAPPDTPFNRLPSYNKMIELAANDPEVIINMTRERREEAEKEFIDVPARDPEEDDGNPPEDENPDAWAVKVRRKKNGDAESLIDNVLLILENDPLIKDRFALNKFSSRGELFDAVPWDEHNKTRRMWSDTDSNGVYWFMEKKYGLTGRGAIDAGLDLHAARHAFNEVQDYLNGLIWDGTPRLNTLFSDYLGAENTPYTQAVCRKIFVAAVARAMNPGCKFDNMVILCGPQGIGKSTLIKKMAREEKWFTDDIKTFEGKETSELIQGIWLVEIAELDAFRRTEVSRIKQFLSLSVDRYRAAYAHYAKEFPRCCVFFGTSNKSDFLQDMTGNRRFWPVDVGIFPHKNVFTDLAPETIDQVWAEAKAMWMIGEPLYLTGDVAEAAQKVQEAHRDASSQEGMIMEFVSRKVPEDWQRYTLEERRGFWLGNNRDPKLKLVDRDRIAAIEIWCELYNRAPGDLKRSDAREINDILLNIPEYVRSETPLRFGPYNVQRGYKRV